MTRWEDDGLDALGYIAICIGVVAILCVVFLVIFLYFW